MTIWMLNLTVTNVGGVKQAKVTAKQGPQAGAETFSFRIIDQNVNATVQFQANEVKDVIVTHTAKNPPGAQGGIVSVANGSVTKSCFLDVDAASSACG